VFFEVEDDGIGIPESVKTRSSTRSSRPRSRARDRSRLSISYAIVQEHQGTLLAESEAGRAR